MSAHPALKTRYSEVEKKHGRKTMLEEIARGGIEQMVEFEEGAGPDEIFDDCYNAAFDALVTYGIPTIEAREAARLEATKFAMP